MQIYAHAPSDGARLLANALRTKRIRREGPPRRFDVVVNWGGSQFPARIQARRIINSPAAVHTASDKLACFRDMEGRMGPRVPEWTTIRQTAARWVAEGCTVVARTVLRGSGGVGIVICEPGGVDIPAAPLYTKYVPKKSEYRIHCTTNGAFWFQRKVRRAGDPEPKTWKVRNLENGFIYQSEERGDVPKDVVDQAVRALLSTDLDFGAVDVVYNDKERKAYVLEINTAPGLIEATAEAYARELARL